MSKKPVGTLKVESFMIPNVHVIMPTMSVREAIDLLMTFQISGAPIVDQNGKLLSVISQTDLMIFAAQGELDTKIQQKLPKLTPPEKLITVSKSDAFVNVFKQFLTTRYRRVLVVDGAGKLQGIVSRSTILKVFMDQQ